LQELLFEQPVQHWLAEAALVRRVFAQVGWIEVPQSRYYGRVVAADVGASATA